MSAFTNLLTNSQPALADSGTSKNLPRSASRDPQLEVFLGQAGGEWVLFKCIFSAKLTELGKLQAPQTEAHRTTVAQLEPPQESGRQSIEMRWLVENSGALEAHRGEWLLIVGTELVAHSRNFGDIQAGITARGIESPFVYYVPTEEESNFIA